MASLHAVGGYPRSAFCTRGGVATAGPRRRRSTAPRASQAAARPRDDGDEEERRWTYGPPSSSSPPPSSASRGPSTSASEAAGYQECAAQAGPPPVGDDWLRLPGAEVLLPPGGARPRAVLHFIGGAFVGAAPSSAYGNLLSRLSQRGLAIVATPVVPSLAHGALAAATDAAFADAWATLTPRWGGWIPVFGVGHSLGAKLTAMSTASPSSRVRRVGNVLMSFNNPSLRESVPVSDQLSSGLRAASAAASAAATSPAVAAGVAALSEGLTEWARRSRAAGGVPPAGVDAVERLGPLLGQWARSAGFGTPAPTAPATGATDGGGIDGEFDPPPRETDAAIAARYSVARTLVVKFQNDSLDSSPSIVAALTAKYGRNGVVFRELPGSHVTPLTPVVTLPPSSGVGGAGDIIGAVGRVAADKVAAELDGLCVVIDAFVTLELELIEQGQRLSSGS
ncbi:hypothetical protein MMPV_006566 [Pyropia vietnamensis]